MKHFIFSLLFVLLLTSVAPASFVTVPDNGGGTAQMPIQSAYPSINPMVISAGLPPASQININAIWLAPTVSAEQPGGTLSGTKSAGGGPFGGMSGSTTAISRFQIGMPHRAGTGLVHVVERRFGRRHVHTPTLADAELVVCP